MSNSETVATFVGGAEGVAVPGALNQAPVAGVGTTFVAGTTPLVNGGLFLTNGQTGATAVGLPASWPLTAPLVVSNTGAVASLVFPSVATQQINGAAAGVSYAVAPQKAVSFYYAGAGQWVAVGA